jgi:hypothetical protein
MLSKKQNFKRFQNNKVSSTEAAKVLGGRRPVEPQDIDCSNPQDAGQVRYCDDLIGG